MVGIGHHKKYFRQEQRLLDYFKCFVKQMDHSIYINISKRSLSVEAMYYFSYFILLIFFYYFSIFAW